MALLEKVRPTRAGIIIISCSDPRLDPVQMFGNDKAVRATHVRNAGGRASDALRSLAVLGTLSNPGMVVVVHHTDCGLTHIRDDDVRKYVAGISPGQEASLKEMKFGELTGSIEDTIRGDVALIRQSPLVGKDVQVVGLKYDTFTGLLSEVHRE